MRQRERGTDRSSEKEGLMFEAITFALVASSAVVCAVAVRLAWLDAMASSKVKRAKHASCAAGRRCGDGDGELNP